MGRPPKLTPEFLAQWKAYRQRARTDTLWLAKDVLGYKDITPEVHGGIVANLPKFTGGSDEYDDAANRILYTPERDMWALEGPRNFLTIFMRGGLKTTIATITHAVQWILNYPDVRILASSATGDQTTKLVRETKGQFQFNDKLRWLFPEFCPEARRAADFGSQEQFITPARQRKTLKDPTFSTCSIGKVIAGGHYDVIIHSDLVDKENVKTPSQLREVKDHYKYCGPLLERSDVWPHHGWILVEGTIYDFSDNHQELLDRYKDNKDWSIYVQGCYKDDGTPQWPSRYPAEELERIKVDQGDYIFSAQYLCSPIPTTSQLATLDEIRFVPVKFLDQILPMLRLHVTIDLHGMEDKKGNDYTVITLAGFDRDGRCYILEIYRAHFTPFEVIEKIFDIYQRYPRIIDFKVEKDAHARVLLPFLKREMTKRQKFPSVIAVPRDTRVSKAQRIVGLQPWFRGDVLKFSEKIAHRIELVQEITRFPNYAHDDILDTLADQMKNRDGGVESDTLSTPSWQRTIPYDRHTPRFMGFDPVTHEAMWTADMLGFGGSWHEMTGL